MFDRDQWAEVFQVLAKNPFRTAATAFGVMWGLLMLIVMMGAGRGLENGVKGNFNTVTNSMFLWAQTTTMPYAGFKRGRRFNLRSDDVAYLKSKVPEIDILSPRLQLGGFREDNNVTRGALTGSFSVYGDTPAYFKIEPRPIVRGRFLNDADLSDLRKVCVIGQRVYEELYLKDQNPIGTYIKIGGVNFQVIGLYKSVFTGERAERDTKSIFVPLTTFQKAFNYGDLIGWMSIVSVPGEPVSEMEQQVLKYLKIKHKINPDDARAFGFFNVEKEYNNMNAIFRGIAGLSWFVGVLTLLAGIIGVSNIMLVIVKERTKEIGVRKALGATPWSIVSQVMLESLFLSAIAGFFGVILGVWTLELVNNFMQGQDGAFRNPGVDFGIVVAALLILVIAGALAGLIPALRAVRIKPVEALRAE